MEIWAVAFDVHMPIDLPLDRVFGCILGSTIRLLGKAMIRDPVLMAVALVARILICVIAPPVFSRLASSRKFVLL